MGGDSLLCSITELLFFLKIFLFFIFWEREKWGGGETEKSICCSTCFCIHWLILVCVLSGNWNCNLGIRMMLQPTELPSQGPELLFFYTYLFQEVWMTQFIKSYWLSLMSQIVLDACARFSDDKHGAYVSITNKQVNNQNNCRFVIWDSNTIGLNLKKIFKKAQRFA